MRQLLTLIISSVLIAACARPPIVPHDAGAALDTASVIDVTQPDAPVVLASTGPRHHTTAVITNVTDPEHPVELWRGDNNISECGARNLLALAIGSTTMGASSGAADSLGQLCAGTDPNATGSCVRSPMPLDAFGNVVIGGAAPNIGAHPCTGAGAPYPCCLASNSGCTITPLDVTLFSRGQPNGTNASVRANWLNWLAGTGWMSSAGFAAGSGVFGLVFDAAPTLYFNGSTLEGVQIVATAGTGSGNSVRWCEYAVEFGTGNPNVAGKIFGPFANTGASCTSGTRQMWLLNHAAITGTPCTVGKSSGDIWTITITITFV